MKYYMKRIRVDNQTTTKQHINTRRKGKVANAPFYTEGQKHFKNEMKSSLKRNNSG